MKRKELIELLMSTGTDDDEVVIAHPSHDYWHNVLATGPTKVQMGYVANYEYDNQKVLIDEYRADPDTDQKAIVIVVI